MTTAITTTRIETDRLVLRPLLRSDAPRIAQLLNNYQVSKMLSIVPFPYTLKDAETWIDQCMKGEKENGENRYRRCCLRRPKAIRLCIELKKDQNTDDDVAETSESMIGMVSIEPLLSKSDECQGRDENYRSNDAMNDNSNRREGGGVIGYWLGEPWWGRGIMTEAARAAVRYAFSDGDLTNINNNESCGSGRYEYLTGSYAVGNEASRKVLERVGFREYNYSCNPAAGDGGEGEGETPAVVDRWPCKARGGELLECRRLRLTQDDFFRPTAPSRCLGATI